MPNYKTLLPFAPWLPALLILMACHHSPATPPATGPIPQQHPPYTTLSFFVRAWQLDEHRQHQACAALLHDFLDSIPYPRKKDSLFRYLSLYCYNLPPALADSVDRLASRLPDPASASFNNDLLQYRNAKVRWLLRINHLPAARQLEASCRPLLLNATRPDSTGLAGYWENQAQLFSRLNVNDSALLMVNQCLDYYRRHANQFADHLQNIFTTSGIIHKNLLAITNALNDFDSARYWMIKSGRDGGVSSGILYMNAGSAWLNIGEFDKTRDAYHTALSVFEKLHDTLELGILSHNTGLLYFEQYDYPNALQFARMALQYLTQVLPPHDPQLLLAEQQLAIVSDETGDTLSAARYLQEMDVITRANFQPEDVDYQIAFSKKAAHYARIGLVDSAIRLYQSILQKLTIAEPVPGISTDNVCYDLAATCYDAGRYDLAFPYFSRCIGQEKKLYGPDNIFTLYTTTLAASSLGKLHRYGQAVTLLTPACLSLDRQQQKGQLGRYANNFYKWQIPFTLLQCKQSLYAGNTDSLKHILGSLGSLESFAQNYLQELTGAMDKGTQDQYEDYYSLQIVICNTLYARTKDSTYLEKAFQCSEKKKEIPLRLSLKKQIAMHFAGVPDSLLKKEEDLTSRLAYTEKNYSAAQADGDSSESAFYDNILATAHASLDSMMQEIEKNYGRYYSLKYSLDAAGLSDCRHYLQGLNNQDDSGVAWLQYIAAGDSIYAILIDGPQLAFQSLAPRHRADSLVVAYNQALRDNDFNRFKTTAGSLYRLLLLPLSPGLPRNNGRLIISAEKGLQDLSWEALLVNDTGSTYENLDYLLRHYLISYSPGISTLSYQQTIHSFSTHQTGPFISFAPGFTQQVRQAVFNDTHDSSYFRLIRQPWAQAEAVSAADLFSGRSYTGMDATSTAYFSQVAHAGVLHFGTHAVCNDRNPMLSRLYLAAERTDPEAGLFTYDIFAHPTSAKLAVLAACQTGVAGDDPGIGRISLAKAFSFAGCPNQVMTLWDVDDQATASIMNDFYQRINAGEPIASALQKAKLDLLTAASSPGKIARPATWASPYYWSGIVYFGEDQPIHPRPLSLPPWLCFGIPAAIVLLVSGSLIFFRRRRPKK